jgi:GNAT superfamily N-acetyltransferase
MDITVRPLSRQDLPEADRICRLAFGTFFRLPDPQSFMGDAALVGMRWNMSPEAALGAYVDDALVGSNIATSWGSFGFFGPLTVHPDFWGKGIAQRLLAATMDLFECWGTRQAGLFTVPESCLHIALYQRFAFWPQYLTAVMSRPVAGSAPAGGWSTYSALPVFAREACLAACCTLTDAVYPGLDLRTEIRSVADQQLGDTILIYDDFGLAAFAICHIGAGTEAGSGTAYVKFGAVRPGHSSARIFGILLSACESFALARGMEQLVAGINTARHEAYGMMLNSGFLPSMHGLAMQRPNEAGFNRPDCFVIDDWR